MNVKKKKYQQPTIEMVQLDNEISLVLMSVDGNPPYGPGGEGASMQQVPPFFNSNDPLNA